MLIVLGIVVTGVLLLVNAPPVTRLVVGKLLPKVNEQLNGRLAAERVSGSLLTGLTMNGVTLRDPEGEIVLQAEQLRVSYSLWDILHGRYTLGPLVLERPIVRLLKDQAQEQYSILRIFAKEPGNEKRETGSIDLTITNITLEDGAVIATVWRRPAAPQQEEAQALDTVQLQNVNLSLPLLHYSSGPNITRAALLEIASARAFLSDPELALAQLEGEARMQGDSLVIALRTIQLPSSRLSAEAWLVTRPDERRFDATAHVDELVMDDIKAFFSGADIPPEWRLSGDLRTTSLRSGSTLIQGRNLDLAVAGGTIRGQLTLLGQDNEWTAQHSRLDVAGVEVQRLLRAFNVPSNLRAQIDGVITADRRSGTAELQVAGAAGYGVHGPVHGHIRASGSFDALTLQTEFDGSIGELTLRGEVGMGKHLAVRGINADLRRFNLAAVHARAPESSINGHLEGDVQFGSMPREGSLRLYLDSSLVRDVQIDTGVVVARLENGLLTTDTILVRAPGLQMTGSGTFGLTEDQTGDLTLTLDAPSLRAVGPVVSAITLDSVADLDGAVRVTVDASGSVNNWGLGVRAQGHDLVFKGFEADSLNATAEGSVDSLSYSARLVVDTVTAVNVDGRTARGSDGLITVLDSLTIERGEANWRTRSPVQLSGGKVLLDSVTLERDPGPGRLLVSGAFPGAITVTAEQVPIADLLRKGERDSLPDLDGKVTYADGAASGTVNLVTSDRRPLTAEFATKPFHAKLQADSLDLSIFGPLMPSLREVGGWLDGDLAVEGATDAPRLNGRLQLTGAQANVPATGVAYRDVHATLSFEGDAVHVTEMRVAAGKGHADLEGRVQFARLDRPELDIAVRAERFQLMNRRDFLKVAATGDFKLAGSPAEGGAVLAGNATVNEGTGYLDKFMRSSGIDLSDTLYAQFVDTTVLLEATGGRSFVESFMDSLRIDSVSVDLGDNFWLRSPDASIQLAGRMTVRTVHGTRAQTENAEKYSLVGTVRAVRGIYRMTFAPGVTREFTIREGSIRYFGAPRQDAMLDLGADHVVRTATGDEVRITAHIGGTLERPTVSLTSDVSPPLSETELISYLVFGAPTAQAFLGREGSSQERSSVFEKSASQLVGVLSGKIESAVVSQLGLPIDYFRIKPGEVQSGLAGTELVLGMQVRILGYPSYLRASPRFCPREQLLSLDHIGIDLETRLSRQWGVATSVDPLQSCEAAMSGMSARAYQLGIDLFWEKR